MNEFLSHFVVVDTETTGADPFSHEILSAAFVAVTSDQKLNVNVKLDAGANWTSFGISNFQKFQADWNVSAVDAKDAVRRIERFIEDNFAGEVHLVGHNVAFDRFFLARLALRAGVETIRGISHRTVDTYSLLFTLSLLEKIPASATASEGAFQYFDIKIPAIQRHTAMGDALATKELFLKILSEYRSVLLKG